MPRTPITEENGMEEVCQQLRCGCEIPLAIFYAELGAESDKVFEHLEKALDERNSNLLYIKLWSSFDEYRSDLRYKELLKKMGLD